MPRSTHFAIDKAGEMHIVLQSVGLKLQIEAESRISPLNS